MTPYVSFTVELPAVAHRRTRRRRIAAAAVLVVAINVPSPVRLAIAHHLVGGEHATARVVDKVRDDTTAVADKVEDDATGTTDDGQ